MKPKDLFGEPNFMTSHIIGYGWIVEGQKAYEFSRGDSIMGNGDIFGVTVREVGDKNYGHPQSELFFNREDAMGYISDLCAGMIPENKYK